MTLEEMYQEIEGNYSDILDRLRKEERIEKFVLLFLKDRSFQTFRQAMDQGDTEEAFRAVHTLKGVCMNLSFDSLYRISSEITENICGPVRQTEPWRHCRSWKAAMKNMCV